MSSIGQVQPTDAQENEFRGYVRTLEHDIAFRAITNADRRSDEAPTHRLMCRGRHGKEIQIGSAWKRKKSEANGSVVEYLSLSFDDPSFATPIHATAFKNANDDIWEINWRRPQRRDSSKEASGESREAP